MKVYIIEHWIAHEGSYREGVFLKKESAEALQKCLTDKLYESIDIAKGETYLSEGYEVDEVDVDES